MLRSPQRFLGSFACCMMEIKLEKRRQIVTVTVKVFIHFEPLELTADPFVDVLSYHRRSELALIMMFYRYASCCWISTLQLNPGVSWSISTRIDLTYRSDIAGINSSPVTAMQPIVRLQRGCSHSIKIPGKTDGQFYWLKKGSDDQRITCLICSFTFCHFK